MDSTAPETRRPSEKSARGRAVFRTGIRNTKQGRDNRPLPGFRPRFSARITRQSSRSHRSTENNQLNFTTVAVSARRSSPEARLPSRITFSRARYRDSEHGREGDGTGNRNTGLPGSGTPKCREFEHGATGIRNTKQAPLTGSLYTGNRGTVRKGSRSRSVTLSSNQIQKQSTVLLLSSGSAHD